MEGERLRGDGRGLGARLRVGGVSVGGAWRGSEARVGAGGGCGGGRGSGSA